MDSIQILERIIDRGGIIGACAKRYLNNKEQAGQFILECYHQCHNNSSIKLWGEELVMDIRNYIHDQQQEILTNNEKQKNRSEYRSGFLDF